MEAERRPVLGLRERVLELVAIAVLRGGRHDRLDRRTLDATEPGQRVADLGFLRLELLVVGVILEPAAAAGAEVRARRDDTVGPWREHLEHRRLGEPTLDLRDAGADRVAGQAAPDEDDESVQPRDAVAAVGERVDVELELLTGADRGGHQGAERSGESPGTPRHWRTETYTERSRGPSNSQKKTPCQTPSASVPSSRSGISDARAHERGPDVSGGVLLSLLDVLPRPVGRDDALERRLEVARHGRVGVLVDRHAGGRVRDVDEHRGATLPVRRHRRRDG